MKDKAEFITVKSMTDPDVEYTIIKTEEGYRCSCPAFVFNGQKCKHIKKHQHLKYKK